MTKVLTEKQRTAMAATQAAGAAGLTLSAYSKAQGLNVREVCKRAGNHVLPL